MRILSLTHHWARQSEPPLKIPIALSAVTAEIRARTLKGTNENAVSVRYSW